MRPTITPFVLILVIILFLSACSENVLPPKIKKIAVASFLTHKKSIKTDSLLNSNHIKAGIQFLKNTSKDMPEIEGIYCTYKANKAIFYHNFFNPCDSLPFEPLYKSNPFSSSLADVFYTLNNYYTNQDKYLDITVKSNLLDESKSLLRKDPVLYAELMSELGRYYYHEGNNADSSHHYFSITVDIYKKADVQSYNNFIAIRSLIYLQLPLRNMNKGLLYTYDLKPDASDYNFDTSHLIQYYYLSGMLQYKTQNRSKGKQYFDLGFELLDILPCSYHQQELYKVFCSTIVYEMPDINLISYIDSLEILINKYGDFCNFDKIKGEYLFNKNIDIKLANTLLENSFNYINNHKPYNSLQVFTIIYFMYKSCTSLQKFDYALDILYTQCAGKIPEKIQHFDKDSIYNDKFLNRDYYYIILENYASVLLNKYRFSGDNRSLFFAFEIILKAEERVNTELKTFDDDVILNIFNTSTDVYNTGMHICYQLYSITKDSKYIASYFYFLEKNKTRLLFRDIKLAELGKNDFDELHLHEKHLKSKIAQFKNQESLKDSMWFYITKLEYIHEKASNTSVSYINKFDNIKTIDLSDIFKNQKREITYLDINIIDQNLFIFCKNNDRIILESHLIDSSWFQTIKIISDEQSGVSNITPAEYSLHAYKVYKDIFENLTLKNKIVYAANYPFNTINPEALVKKYDQTDVEFKNLKYLIHAYEFERVESIFLSAENENTNTPIVYNDISAFLFSDEKSLLNPNLTLKELPGSIIERKSLESAFQNPKIYSGHHCTKSNFLKSLLTPSDVLHISVHGHGNAQNRNDLYLLFKNKHTIDTVFAYELLTKKIQTPLVLLTACETGKGRYENGEGSYHIARYFTKTGSTKVISALWNLDDLSGSILVKTFYKNLMENQNPNLSLTEAKKSLLINYLNLSHPNYWACLI